jgi:hypothetical protein
MRRALLATTALIASASPALAEPISLSIAAITAFLSTVAFAGITYGTLLQVGLFIAGTALSLLTRPKAPRRIDPGAVKGTLKLGEGEEIRVIGRAKFGGLIVYGNSEGFNRWRLMAHCRGTLSAIEEYFLGGRSVVVESNGAVSSPPYVRPGDLSYIYVKTKLGTAAEAAWSDLTSAFPGIWTANHRGRGIAQSLIRYISPGVTTTKFGRLYQSGVPELQILARGEAVYDIRTATTGWTDNAVLIIRHVLLGFPEWSASMLDDAYNITQANKADQLVATLTGTEKRARLWGAFTSETGREELISALLNSAGARLVLRPGGLWGIQLIDDVQTAEFAFAERDLIDWTFKSGPDGVERPNLVRIKYYSPEVGYELAEINTGVGTVGASWARVSTEITRYGEKPLDLELPFCPSASQAQRIARRLFAFARGDGGVIETNMAGMGAWGCATASIPFPDLGETVICEIDPPRIDAEGYSVNIPYRVVPTLPTWNPATMESPAPEVVPDLAYQSEVPTPAAMTDAIVVRYIGSGAYETRVRIYVPSGATIMEANYRTYTGGLPNPWQSMLESIPGRPHAYVAEDLRGIECDFRSRGFDADENGSASSPIYSVTPALSTGAPSAPTIVGTAVINGTGTAVIVTITVTAPADLKVVRLRLAGISEYPATTLTTQVDARPGTLITRIVSDVPITTGTSSSQDITWTASCFSTGNVASSDVTYTYTIPGI